MEGGGKVKGQRYRHWGGGSETLSPGSSGRPFEYKEEVDSASGPINALGGLLKVKGNASER